MGWVLRLVETGTDGSSRSVDVMAIDRLGDLSDIAGLGLTLAQGKRLVALVQQEIVTAQSRDHAVRRPDCRTCTIHIPSGKLLPLSACCMEKEEAKVAPSPAVSQATRTESGRPR